MELACSNDDHFKQIFIAHVLNIQGFIMGCWSIIVIDSSHMSGSYGGAFFFATMYDANDSMFPLTFGVMRSENYEDWLWFLQNVKKVVGEKKVFII